MGKEIVLLFRFFLQDLRTLSYSVLLLLLFIFAQAAYILQGWESFSGHFLVIAFVLFFLIITNAFEQSLNQDLQDGSFFWLLSQKVDSFTYFLSKCLAFALVILLPVGGIMIGAWWLQHGALGHSLILLLCLLLSGVQITFLSGSLSLLALSHHQNLHFSLPLCLLPLQIPNLIILQALETQHIKAASALLILLGLCLLALVSCQFIVKHTLK